MEIPRLKTASCPMDTSGILCLVSFLILACGESVYNMLLVMLRIKKRREIPQIVSQATESNQHILSKCKSLREYVAPMWAIGPVSQSVFAKYMSSMDTKDAKRFPYERQHITLPDGVVAALDWRHPMNDPIENAYTPVLVLFHGLGGNSTVTSMQAHTLFFMRQGYRSVVFNRRGHGGMSICPPSQAIAEEKQTTICFPQHVNIDDARCAVRAIHERYPNAPKILVGFSAGANLATHIAAESENPFIGFISVSNPYCVLAAAKHIGDNLPLTDLLMATCVKEIVYLQLDNLAPALEQSTLDRLMRSTSIRELDDALSKALYGYDGVDEYHQIVSCKDVVDQVKIPMLALGSEDDLVIKPSLLSIVEKAAEANPNIISVRTERGGHLGWLTGWRLGETWLHAVMLEWIKVILDKHELRS